MCSDMCIWLPFRFAGLDLGNVEFYKLVTTKSHPLQNELTASKTNNVLV